jgi:squalene cyclase
MNEPFLFVRRKNQTLAYTQINFIKIFVLKIDFNRKKKRTFLFYPSTHKRKLYIFVLKNTRTTDKKKTQHQSINTRTHIHKEMHKRIEINIVDII